MRGTGTIMLTAAERQLYAQFVLLRKALGLPQRALDDRIGFTCYVEKLEAGTRRASSKALLEWAEGLGARLILLPPIALEQVEAMRGRRMRPAQSGAHVHHVRRPAA